MNDFADRAEEQSSVIMPSGLACPACSTTMPVPSLAIQLELAVRNHISKYYLGWTVCDGEDCAARTRMMGVYGRRCLGLVKEGCKGTVRLEASGCPLRGPPGLSDSIPICNCTTSYCTTTTSLTLRKRLTRFGEEDDTVRRACDSHQTAADGAEEVRALSHANEPAFAALLGVVDKYLDRNGRRYVDMKGLFGFMERIKL